MSKFDKLKRNDKSPVGALDLVDEKETKPVAETDTSEKSTKVRRSFMLTTDQIRLLNMKKINHPNVNTTLSDIVGLAIEEYCKKEN